MVFIFTKIDNDTRVIVQSDLQSHKLATIFAMFEVKILRHSTCARGPDNLLED